MENQTAALLALDTRYLWSRMQELKAAVDKGDAEATSECIWNIELVCGQSDFAAIRAAADRAIRFITVVHPTPASAPILSFVSGAAALLDAVARNLAAPVPEAVVPLAVGVGD